ncbi:MAG TPA: hypothetical protein V6C88_07640 [Chroococcidiopsis sp.]
MKLPSLASPLLLAVLLIACSNRDDVQNPISQGIIEQLNANSAAPVDLAQVGPAAWEQVCILGPYTDNQATAKVLGFEWDSESKTSIADSDGINVLAFIRNQEVLAFTEHSRDKGDFVKVVAQCFERDQAKLTREVGQDGWIYLVAPSADTP